MTRIALVAAGALCSALAWSHPATERYIPIGESPGISGVRAHIGTIRSVAEVSESGLTMRVGAEEKLVKVDRGTRIYLQKADPRESNALGTYADCRAGREVEAYLADDGTAIWIKIRVP
ncbi:MAG: hypothetical protein ACREQZ_06165 [Woeseiaceae bacterium]